jgi:hypothetical protein
MIPLAVHVGDALDLIVKGIAILAGAFIGAFVVGLVARVLVRLARPKPLQGLALSLVRLCGAAAGGLLVWLLVADLHFGMGLGGDGSGSDKGKDKGPDKEESRKDDKPPPKDKVEPPNGENPDRKDRPLHVFVLGMDDLKQRLKVEKPNIDYCYWIQGDPQTELRDLAGLQKELRRRRNEEEEKGRKLKVFMDRTDNSPDEDNPHFWAPLYRWLRDEKLLYPPPKQ